MSILFFTRNSRTFSVCGRNVQTDFTRNIYWCIFKFINQVNFNIVVRICQQIITYFLIIGKLDKCELNYQVLIVVKVYLLPVEPKPPSPRTVSDRVSHSEKSAFKKGAITSCAMRSPHLTVAGISEWLCNATITSPL